MLSATKRLFTKHPSETGKPQTYLQHGKFASLNSLVLIGAGIAGLIHAVFPFVFKFHGSTTIIKCFKRLVKSGRHVGELENEGLKFCGCDYNSICNCQSK